MEENVRLSRENAGVVGIEPISTSPSRSNLLVEPSFLVSLVSSSSSSELSIVIGARLIGAFFGSTRFVERISTEIRSKSVCTTLKYPARAFPLVNSLTRLPRNTEMLANSDVDLSSGSFES